MSHTTVLTAGGNCLTLFRTVIATAGSSAPRPAADGPAPAPRANCERRLSSSQTRVRIRPSHAQAFVPGV